MTKLKQGVLSLETKGTIGDAITFQQSRGQSIARTKPVPRYTYTLNQAYRRWMYQDYATLWLEQTPTVQAAYRATAHRFHLTAFQYWMKVMLATLPDLMEAWRLDRSGDSTVPNFKNPANAATLFGATYQEAQIQDGIVVDGVDDYASIPTPWIHTQSFTWLCFFTPAVGWGNHVASFIIYNRRQELRVDNTNGLVTFEVLDPALNSVQARSPIPVTPGETYLLGATFSYTDRHARLYFDGILQDTSPELPGYPAPPSPGTSTLGGVAGSNRQAKGVIDNVLIFSRLLTIASMKRWSLRRYSG